MTSEPWIPPLILLPSYCVYMHVCVHERRSTNTIKLGECIILTGNVAVYKGLQFRNVTELVCLSTVKECNYKPSFSLTEVILDEMKTVDAYMYVCMYERSTGLRRKNM